MWPLFVGQFGRLVSMVTLPERVFNPEYERQVLPRELYVP
jgi:hypothetical protein